MSYKITLLPLFLLVFTFYLQSNVYGQNLTPVPLPNLINESFENGLNGWVPDHHIYCETHPLGCAVPFDWHVEPSTIRAQDGVYSLEYFLTGLNDDGVVWIVREFTVPPSSTANVKLSFYLYNEMVSAANNWPIVAYIGEEQPQEETDFAIIGLTEKFLGWKDFTYSKKVTSVSGSIYIALGISVTWESDRNYYIDNVNISSDIPLTPVPITPTPTPPSCIQGDVTCDGKVSLTDLSILLSNFGTSGGRSKGDLDGNGVINLSDLSILLSNFGRSS